MTFCCSSLSNMSPPRSQDLSSETQNWSNSHCPATSRLQILEVETQGCRPTATATTIPSVAVVPKKNKKRLEQLHHSWQPYRRRIKHCVHKPQFFTACLLSPSDLHTSCNLMCYDSTHEVIAAWLGRFMLWIKGAAGWRQSESSRREMDSY